MKTAARNVGTAGPGSNKPLPRPMLGWKTSRLIERETFAGKAKFYAYVQWIAYQQWEAVKKFAQEHGVGLMGDIPLGVSYYSADYFRQPGNLRAGLVGWRAAGAVFQGRCLYPEVGTKLGHPGL